NENPNAERSRSYDRLTLLFGGWHDAQRKQPQLAVLTGAPLREPTGSFQAVPPELERRDATNSLWAFGHVAQSLASPLIGPEEQGNEDKNGGEEAFTTQQRNQTV